LSPNWDQSFEFYLEESNHELRILIKDAAGFGADAAIGITMIPLEKLPIDESTEGWFDIFAGELTAGKVHIHINFRDLHPEENPIPLIPSPKGIFLFYLYSQCF
jgi:hypothetical protein